MTITCVKCSEFDEFETMSLDCQIMVNDNELLRIYYCSICGHKTHIVVCKCCLIEKKRVEKNE